LDFNEGSGFPFSNYLLFRQQQNEHNENMAKWVEMDLTERERRSAHIIHAFQSTSMNGMYPLLPADASDFFRKTFCDDFNQYLKSKHPLAQPPKQYPGFSIHEEED
jgi:hypothetical protein